MFGSRPPIHGHVFEYRREVLLKEKRRVVQGPLVESDAGGDRTGIDRQAARDMGNAEEDLPADAHRRSHVCDPREPLATAPWNHEYPNVMPISFHVDSESSVGDRLDPPPEAGWEPYGIGAGLFEGEDTWSIQQEQSHLLVRWQPSR